MKQVSLAGSRAQAVHPITAVQSEYSLWTRDPEAEVRAVAAAAGATPAQVALAWVLTQGDDLAPIPGTKRVSRLEENVGADALALSAEQLARLSAIEPPVGARYADMTTIDR
jgi:aryl-alcohol dehydrogenase-like predicted oxidoreductase